MVTMHVVKVFICVSFLFVFFVGGRADPLLATSDVDRNHDRNSNSPMHKAIVQENTASMQRINKFQLYVQMQGADVGKQGFV